MATLDSFLDCKDACDELFEACQGVVKYKDDFIKMAQNFQMILGHCEDRYWKASDFQLTDDIKELTRHVNRVKEIEANYAQNS